MPTTSYSNPGGTGARVRYIAIALVGSYSGSGGLLINGDTTGTGFFFSGGAASGYSLTFDFGSDQVIIDEAKWYQDINTSHGTWKWQGSDDGSTWTDVGTGFTLGGVATQTQTELNGNTTAYKQYRLQGVSGTASSAPWLYEIEFQISLPTNRSNGTAYTNAGGIGNRTSLIAVTVSSPLDFYDPNQIVDGSLTGGFFWHADPVAGNNFVFDFSAQELIDEAVIYLSPADNYGTWKWQGSNDNATWTDIGGTFTLGSISAVTGVQRISQLWGNTGAWRYWRMYCTVGSTLAGGLEQYREIEFRIGPPLAATTQPTVMVIC